MEHCKPEMHTQVYLHQHDKFICTRCDKEWLPKEKRDIANENFCNRWLFSKQDINQAINEGLDKQYEMGEWPVDPRCGNPTQNVEPRFISVCCERDPCKCGKEDYGPGGKAVLLKCPECNQFVTDPSWKRTKVTAEEECNGCPRAAKLETRLAEHFYTKHEIDKMFLELTLARLCLRSL